MLSTARWVYSAAISLECAKNKTEAARKQRVPPGLQSRCAAARTHTVYEMNKDDANEHTRSTHILRVETDTGRLC